MPLNWKKSYKAPQHQPLKWRKLDWPMIRLKLDTDGWSVSTVWPVEWGPKPPVYLKGDEADIIRLKTPHWNTLSRDAQEDLARADLSIRFPASMLCDVFQIRYATRERIRS